MEAFNYAIPVSMLTLLPATVSSGTAGGLLHLLRCRRGLPRAVVPAQWPARGASTTSLVRHVSRVVMVQFVSGELEQPFGRTAGCPDRRHRRWGLVYGGSVAAPLIPSTRVSLESNLTSVRCGYQVSAPDRIWYWLIKEAIPIKDSNCASV